MFYDRVIRNIQNRHKLIKHMNSFIKARIQRKLRKFPENPFSGSRVSGPTIRVPDLGSQVPPMSWIPGLGSRVPSKKWVPSLRCQVPPTVPVSRVPLIGYAVHTCFTHKMSFIFGSEILFMIV